MRRETQNILLLLLGGALLKIAINGDYLRYVKPAQQPWIIAAGAVMVLLGVLAMGRDLLAARRGRARSGGHAEHAGHAHPARSAWLLVLPVLAVFLVAPPALGSDSVTRTQARAPQGAVRDASAFPPLPEGPVVPLTVTEFVTRAGWDGNGSLNGRTVSLTGFVVHEQGSTLLARMVIGCCAADAYPVTVRVTGGTGAVAGLPADTWIEVTGQVVPGSATTANGYTPDLTLATARRVQAPQDPYEY
ncbi:TIGR03943 family putative permease subunit [Amycolatopsis suaedae]|uniref:TIGR03943 family protein n=1 Tax=Amycolatopsis suaedae TaxID=2510978 RepID=A0A4Q7IZ88_9PSEU|nr:TIGR03943 family protein [Amycolatopsis suaedae]RZQ60350.1 TIGR03943 family protein [Amycolatopsis suaedae]